MMNPFMPGKSWMDELGGKFDFPGIHNYLTSLRQSAIIYPPQNKVYAWSHHCSIENVKVVILGQDPYPTPGLACGLSFGVGPSIPPPESLKNIFEAMRQDMGFIPPSHGVLTKWAQQGVLLLNSALTVQDGLPESHLSYWTDFTDAVIKCVNDRCTSVFFMLWGNFAKAKGINITNPSHKVLEACHPVNRSIDQNGQQFYPFIECGHFSEANKYLQLQGKTIDWSL